MLLLDNWPASPSGRQANFGLFRAAPTACAQRCLALATAGWAEQLVKSEGTWGTQIGYDQTFFNRQLQSAEPCVDCWAMLNRSAFANTMLLVAYGHGRQAVPQPEPGSDQRKQALAGLPHTHLAESLVAFHAISVSLLEKRALLERAFSPTGLTRASFATTPWQQLIAAKR